jgi:hypothetical protein
MFMASIVTFQRTEAAYRVYPPKYYYSAAIHEPSLPGVAAGDYDVLN